MAAEQLVGNIKGPPGDSPNHEWAGTQLRFTYPNGQWGNFTDLKGAPGKDFKWDYTFNSIAEMNAALSQAQAGEYAMIQSVQGAADEDNAKVYTVKIVDSVKQWLFIGDFSGATGATPNITVSATTLAEGSTPTAVRSGTNENPHIVLGIPRGNTGATGATGTKGNDGAVGATPNITVVAQTLAEGASATATKSGTNENPTITLGIPRGATGDIGPTGAQGPRGRSVVSFRLEDNGDLYVTIED